MAFTDALIDHSDARVVLVDRRHGPGGHWLNAYPFVRLHQASAFYGVASTLLGGGRVQAPTIPADTPPPFEAAAGTRVIPVNELPLLNEAANQYIVVGSGKTATDACVWLLAHGVDAAAICWVRPREPWMLNRAMVQPNPAVFLSMAADVMAAAAAATSPEELFLRMEDAGIMFRIDSSVLPTMAKTPTLASWELELLRTVEKVVRLGHLRRVEQGRLVLDNGTVGIAPDAVVVHGAASGLQ